MVNFIRALVNYIFLNGRSHSKGIQFYSKQKENVVLKTDDDQYIGAYLINKDIKPNENTKFFVVCHGKGTDREDATGHSKLRTQKNKNAMFLMIDYRGFGDSSADYSREGINLDVKAAFKYLTDKHKAKNIALIGHSFGAAVSLSYAKYASENKDKDIINPSKIYLFAPFEDLSSILHTYKPLKILFYMPGMEKFLFQDVEFDNGEVVEKFQDKIVIFHGKKDQLVPVEHSQRMTKKAKKAKVIFTEDSHDQVFENLKNWETLFKEADVK